MANITIKEKFKFKKDSLPTIGTGSFSAPSINTDEFVKKWEDWNSDLNVIGITTGENFVFTGLDGSGGSGGTGGSIVTDISFSGRILTLSQSNASALSATFNLNANDIPSLDTSKITSGILNDARIPSLAISKISGLQTVLDSKLSSINLSYTASPTTGIVTNSAGNNATLPSVTTVNSGLMLPADKSKLDGIATNANNYVHPTFTVINQTLSGAVVPATLITNSIGSVTGFTTRTLTPANIGAPTTTGVGASGTWLINITGTSSLSTLSNGLSFLDTRAVNDQPQNKLGNRLSADFKNISAVNNPPVNAGNGYAHILTVAGWNTNETSGGLPTQLSFGSDGISFRQAISLTTWGAWNSTVNINGNQSINGLKTFTDYVQAANYVFSGVDGSGGSGSGGGTVTGISFSGRTLTLTQSNSGNLTALFNLIENDVPTLGIGKINGLQSSLDGKVDLTTNQTINGVKTFTNIRASNFYDFNGTYNVNLGNNNQEGRGIVAGYSGTSYGGIGYNVRHTLAGGTYIAPSADTSNYLLYNQGFTFFGAGTGTAGRTLNYTQLARIDNSGNLTTTGNITAPIFNGSFSGNATTATTLQTSRTITIGGTTRGFNGSQNISWSLGEIGAPSTTGVGASGTWGINVNGFSDNLRPNYIGGIQTNPQTYFNQGIGVKVAMTGIPFAWCDTLWINGYTGSDVPNMIAIHTARNGQPRMWLSSQSNRDTSYGTSYEILSLWNYNTYVPTLTGVGASGTWGINVTGNSNTATTLQTSRTINGVSFNGGSNINIRVFDGTGNDYNTAGLEVRGNGSTNTIFPSIGFHQPSAYAGSIQLKSSSKFEFIGQGGVNLIDIGARKSDLLFNSTYNSESNGGLTISSSTSNNTPKMILGADISNGISYIAGMTQGTTWNGNLSLQPMGGTLLIRTPTALSEGGNVQIAGVVNIANKFNFNSDGIFFWGQSATTGNTGGYLSWDTNRAIISSKNSSSSVDLCRGGTVGLRVDSSLNTLIGTTVSTGQKLQVNGNIRVQGVGNGIYFDTTGVDFTNSVRVINSFETLMNSGRGSAGFIVTGDSNIRLGFGSAFTNAQSALVINPNGNTTTAGISYATNFVFG